jgi:hypothetical protein
LCYYHFVVKLFLPSSCHIHFHFHNLRMCTLLWFHSFCLVSNLLELAETKMLVDISWFWYMYVLVNDFSIYLCLSLYCKFYILIEPTKNVLNLKIDVVLKASCAIVIRRFSLNEAPLGLFKFISDYLPYFEKINIFFNIIAKKIVLIYKDWSKLFVRFIRNNLNQVVHTLA